MTLEAGWRGVYGVEADVNGKTKEEDPESVELPPLEKGQEVKVVSAESEAKETRPPARYTEATLLSAMETAGKLIDDEELREAMKEHGLGTPATRAETIETLIRREYIERAGKDLVPTPKGLQVITMLEENLLTSPELTGDWEKRLGDIEHGKGQKDDFIKGIEDFTRVDRRGDRRPRQGKAAARAGRARPLPTLRRRNGRDHPRELEGFRLYELEEPRGDRLRIRDLEARRGPHADPGGRPPVDRRGQDEGSLVRLSFQSRQTFSRAARLE